MLKGLVDKFGNKERLILSVIGLIGSIFGGTSLVIVIQNIWSLVVVLGMVGSLSLWLDMYDEAKEGYCYEVSSKYFDKNKENIDGIKEKNMLNKLIRVNNFFNKLQVSIVPSMLVMLLLQLIFGVSLPVALNLCGYTCLSTFLVTLPCMEYTDFYIDVLCEVLENVKSNKEELFLVTRVISTKRDMSNALSLNPGISKYRYKYVSKDVSSSDISREEVRELSVYLNGYKSKVLKNTRTRR